jgi:replicative DNA helicase
MDKQYIALKEIMEEAVRSIRRRYESPGAISGVPTGFIDLDKITAGLQPSNMITIAGRPGMGKTILALHIARNAAVKAHTPVMYFSLETKATQILIRLVCSEARVSQMRLQSGTLSEEEWQRITEWTGKLIDAPIFIDDTPALSIGALQEKSRKAKEEHDIGLIIIDCLQLMTTSERFPSQEQEINAINQSIKTLAYDLDVPVVICSGLLPAMENREDKRPTLADLGCGNLEQISDCVMLIYHPEAYGILDEDGNTQEGVVEISVSKPYPEGSAFLTYVEEYLRFEEPEMYREFP